MEECARYLRERVQDASREACRGASEGVCGGVEADALRGASKSVCGGAVEVRR